MDRKTLHGLLNGYVLPSRDSNDARISYGKTFYAKSISGGGAHDFQTTRIGRFLHNLGRAIYFIPCRAFTAYSESSPSIAVRTAMRANGC